MKWNAIISRSQYKKTLEREREIAQALPGSQEADELRLLRMLIKDYEERQYELQPVGFQMPEPMANRAMRLN